MSATFTNNSIQIKALLDDKAEAFLYEAAELLKTQASRISPVDSSDLKGSWDYMVDMSKGEAKVGSPLEYSIYNEFGTGEYAANGDGVKGGWYVPEGKLSAKAKRKMRKTVIHGEVFYFTRGRRPSHTLEKAFTAKKNAIINRAKQIFGEIK